MGLQGTGKTKIEVCFSPRQYDLYNFDYDIVVAIDVLRATTAITAGIYNGLNSIIPVSTVDDAQRYKDQGFIVAAERGGEIVEGFDFGNSPYAFLNEDLKGKDVVLTTTNGTKAINIAKNDGKEVFIGALSNLDVLSEHLINLNQNVLLLCSGWKDKFNLEDTICAGAIADRLIETNKFESIEDSSIAAKYIYQSAKDNMFGYLKSSSHRRRLKRLNLNEDIKFCLTPNSTPIIPYLKDDKIVKL